MELLRQSIDVQNLNLGVQVALAVGTWVLVIVSAHYMKKSAGQISESNKINREANEIAKSELKSRLKPELDLKDVKGSLETSQGKHTMRVMGRIKNTGTVSAVHINTPFSETSKDYLWDIVKEKDLITTSKFFASLTPETETEFLFPMSWANDRVESKMVIWMEYEYEDIAKQKGEKVFLLTVNGGGGVDVKQFVKPDIEIARAEAQKGQ